MKLASITRHPKKGKPGEKLREAELVAGLGLAGDFHQGGDRQLSMLADSTRVWLDSQTEPGLCFGRFKENLLIEGLEDEKIVDGCLLQIGGALLKVRVGKKYCHSECPLFSRGESCKLPESVLFASVAQGGIIRLGDRALMKFNI